MPLPYFEVYAPIHDPETGALIAVGEIYQDATEILRDRAVLRRERNCQDSIPSAASARARVARESIRIRP